MELRKEYEAIAQQFASSIYDCTGLGEAHDTVRNAVTACQELADRPPKELSASEKYDLWLSCYDGQFNSAICKDGSEVVDRIIAGYLKRQREPQVVKFRATRFKSDHAIVSVIRADAKLSEAWEWLEPAQEFEVRI